MTEFPVAELTPGRRLQVLAESLPGAIYAEVRVDASVEDVWQLVSDMDSSMPYLFANFTSWQTISRDGVRLRASAGGRLGLRSLFDVTLRPGLCVMQDRRFVGGLAAVEDNGRTRFSILVGLRGPGRHLGVPLRPLVRVLANRLGRRLNERLSRQNEGNSHE